MELTSLKEFIEYSFFEISHGKWLSLSQITYTDPTGKERTWEAVSRTTSQTGSDAVCVIAILKRMLKYDCLVLVKQYRPPMKCYTLEFPAGLIDPDETATTCGLRELKEETGYIGTLKHESPVTCLDPGIGGTTCHLITAEIDGDIDSNIHPKNKLGLGQPPIQAFMADMTATAKTVN
ncbi:NUDT5 [Mytilus edulis]|uniref:NUDT5 n=1 Tax=Mytilus edulis TaxID=6550 RepID=A0A8S3TBP3_MYTED|nr:NUDT5 [Mytilus edulis]